MKTKKHKLIKNTYTRKEKKKIANKVLHLTEKEVLIDFKKLQEIGCLKHKLLSNVGNNVVNKYTFVERLNTVTLKNVNFYDIWKNKPILRKKPFIQKLLKHYENRKTKYSEPKMWFRISNLYYSAVSIFKPIIAMDIYCRYQPKCILDFTMGWGGRLVGACALNIPKYIGIDNNMQLKIPYNHLNTFLNKHSDTEIQLLFEDALTVDYSKLDYDCVLTSPPYYNIEIYGDNGEKKKESLKELKERWNKDFYSPLFEKTFKYLKKEGHYCINISNEIFENVAVKILGKPAQKIPMPKTNRSFNKYKEFIYVWKKL